MPDALYQRYQDAHRAHQNHHASCTHCTSRARCPEGSELWTRFERAQDSYLAHLRNRPADPPTTR